MNRQELTRKLGPITSSLLKEKGYISMIDVFIRLGYLTDKDVEDWRMKRVPFLEKRIKVNLGKIGFIVKAVSKNCRNGKLKPSYTVYKSWGKGKKIVLQFSKTGLPHIEEVYGTHYVKRVDEA